MWLVEITWVAKNAPPDWMIGLAVKEHEHVGAGVAFVPASRKEAARYKSEDDAMKAVRTIGRRIEFAVFAPVEEYE